MRYKNFCASHYELPLEKFVEFDDNINCGLGGYATEINNAIIYADHVISNVNTKDDYINKLKTVNFADDEALRPHWDTYFLQVAELVGRRSNCIKRAVGAVLVKDRQILSTGYNGAPFGIPNCNKGGCVQCASTGEVDISMDQCICLHAEQNVVFEVGVSKALNATIYSTTFPCLLCTKALIQAGVCRIVYYREYDKEFSMELCKKAAVKVERHSPFIFSSYLKLS